MSNDKCKDNINKELQEQQEQQEFQDLLHSQPDFTLPSREELRKKQIDSMKEKGIPEKIINLLINRNYSQKQKSRIENLPWSTYRNKPPINVSNAKNCLNDKHIGMNDVKARIMDYVCTDFRGGAALLLVGPPGVGKTSIAIQIAKAIGRPHYEIALSGIATSHEITGVDPTFSEAAPGEIIRAIEYTETFAPVIILDEIDKVGRSKEHGDPQNALLEVLDSSRDDFRDRYLSIPIDITDIVFIATANDLSDISPILKDRLEIIEIGGYSKKEKLLILDEHVIPSVAGNILQNDFEKALKITSDAIETIVYKYVSDPGIREMYTYVDKISRRAYQEFLDTNRKVIVTEGTLHNYLGKPTVIGFSRPATPKIGCANTAVTISTKYAKVMPIQTEIFSGNGQHICTGGIEGFAKEAVSIAISIVRHFSEELNIPHDYFNRKDLHVHSEYHKNVPRSPSVSLAIFIAIVSSVLKIEIPQKILYAGGLLLDGQTSFLPDIEVLLEAAIESSLDTAIIPIDNIRLDNQLIENYKSDIKIIPVGNVLQALQYLKGVLQIKVKL